MQWVIQDIINSELAYLGYEGVVNGGALVGITYFGGAGSIYKNHLKPST